jgi:hypothetical protein
MNQGGTLFLYLCSFFRHPSMWPAEQIAKGLADLLNFKVLHLAQPIWFHPELQASPLDEKRGRVSLAKNGPIVEDVAQFDEDLFEVP